MARVTLSLFQKQPRPFIMIFMLEIWERFGYYTVQGILVLYFIRFLGFSEDLAYYTFGAFFALVYGMVAIGGYLGDKVLGTKRTIVLGLIILALGYLALALTTQRDVFLALGLICVGNGLFKANPASLLSKCYEKNDPRLHGAFTLYYMSINLGSIFALFLGPWIAVQFGYPYAFILSCIGILLGLVNYWFQRHQLIAIDTWLDNRKVFSWQWCLIICAIFVATFISAYLLQHPIIAKKLVWIISGIVVAMYFFYLYREKPASRQRMVLAFILMIEAVLFFTLYQQMPTSLNLFAVNNVTPFLFGININPQSYQALNPIWIVTMSPVVAMFYAMLARRGYSFPIPYKFALGMTFCGLSFLVLFFARYYHDGNGMVSSGWMVLSYFFQSLGELLVSALGIAMIAELVPSVIAGFVMGMWFLTSSLAGFIGATVATFTALPKNMHPGVESLMIYTHVFASIGLVTIAIALLLWLISPRLTKLLV